MINRFHSSVAVHPAVDNNAQIKKLKSNDDFASLLNDELKQDAQPSKNSTDGRDNQSMNLNVSTVLDVSLGTYSNDTRSIIIGARQQAPELLAENIKILSPQDSSNVSVMEISAANLISNYQWVSSSSTTDGKVDIKFGVVGEGVELIAVPWHLQANAGLSYQSANHLMQLSQKADDVNNSKNLAKPYSSETDHLFSNISNDPAFDDIKFNESVFFKHAINATANMANTFEITRALRSDTRSSLIMWPQRVLHWLSDGDTTTAWVRDYQLDASGARMLVDALRCFADKQGFSLRRIMLNGHELWRAPSNS
jgi:hypothetical protein